MSGPPAASEVIEQLRSELRDRLGTLTALVEPGATCSFCPRDAVTLLPLAVQDPDRPIEIVPVDVASCARCQAQRQPRVLAAFDVATRRRLIRDASIELEAWPRPLARVRGA